MSSVTVSSVGLMKFSVRDAIVSSFLMTAFHFFSADVVSEIVRGRCARPMAMTDVRLCVVSSVMVRLIRIATGRWSIVRPPVFLAMAAFG